MIENIVHNKLQQFAKTEDISVYEFKKLLKTSSRSQKMNVMWRTEGSADGSGKPPHITTHLMWWDSSEYVGGSAGGSATKASHQQFNLNTNEGWRTLSYENIVNVLFKGKRYNII
jgi:hypothetical protein